MSWLCIGSISWCCFVVPLLCWRFLVPLFCDIQLVPPAVLQKWTSVLVFRQYSATDSVCRWCYLFRCSWVYSMSFLPGHNINEQSWLFLYYVGSGVHLRFAGTTMNRDRHWLEHSQKGSLPFKMGGWNIWIVPIIIGALDEGMKKTMNDLTKLLSKKELVVKTAAEMRKMESVFWTCSKWHRR